MNQAARAPYAGQVGASASSPPAKPATTHGLDRFFTRAERGNSDLILRVADEWRAMCSHGPCNQPFFRPEWIYACVQAFAPTATLILIAVREGGRLRAVLPLLEENPRLLGVPFSRLRSATNPDYSCRFDIIRDAGDDGDQIIAAIWNCLRELPGWDVVELSNIPPGGATEKLVELAREDRYRVWQREFARSPYIPLPLDGNNSDFSRFVRSANLKRKLRRRWGKLQETGTVLLHRVEHADATELKRFYALEQSGWKGKSGTAIACIPEVSRFYELVAAAASHFGYFSLYRLEVSGNLIAAHFGLTLAGRYFPLKVAYDETYGAYSPGHLLVGLVLQDATKRGLSECECLGDSEEWKMQWLVEIRPHTVYYIHRNRPLGNLVRLQTVLKYRLRTLARKLSKPLPAGIRAYISR